MAAAAAARPQVVVTADGGKWRWPGVGSSSGASTGLVVDRQIDHQWQWARTDFFSVFLEQLLVGEDVKFHMGEADNFERSTVRDYTQHLLHTGRWLISTSESNAPLSQL